MGVSTKSPKFSRKVVQDKNIEDFSMVFYGVRHSRLALGYQNCCGRPFAEGTRLAFGNMSEAIVPIESNSSLRPIVSLGRHELGRFSYTPFVVAPETNALDNDQLVRNILKWISSSKLHPFDTNVGFCVSPEESKMFHRAIEGDGNNLLGYITYSDINNCSTNQALSNFTYLKEHDVVIVNDHYIKTEAEIKNLQKYVASGGGLMLGSDPWQYNSRQILLAKKTLNSLGGVTLIINGELKPFAIVRSNPLKMQCIHPSKQFNDLNLKMTHEEMTNVLC